MPNNRPIRVLIGASICGLVMLTSAPRVASDPPPKKNVLLMVWDTTRADHLSLYGYERKTSPNLEKIAADSVVFEQAIPGSFWTSPSVATLFSGMFGHNHQVDYHVGEEYSLNLPDEIQTMAETFKAQGYRTGMFTNKAMVYKNETFMQGFDRWVWKGSYRLGQSALDFIDEESDQPWFVVAYWSGPHAPYSSDDEAYHIWQDTSMAINIRGCSDNEYPDEWYCWKQVNSEEVVLSEAQWAQLEALYDEEILWYDALLGEFWEALKSRGAADDAIVAFTSDHGEAFNDHEREKTWHLRPYENNQRVPMILRAPGIFPAKRVETAVRNMDLYATLVLASGNTLDHPLNSEDLRPVIEGAEGDRPALGFTHGGDGWTWLRTGDHKIIFSRSEQHADSTDPKFLEVYDLRADPLEQNNLGASDPELVARLKAQWEEVVAATTLGVAGGASLSDEQYEMLKSLGYIAD